MKKETKKDVKNVSKEKDMKKKVSSKKNKKVKKENYFKGVNKELKLVKWPSGKDIIKYTISTIIFCIILCILFILLNAGLSLVKGWLA